jgi:hypothetical protein
MPLLPKEDLTQKGRIIQVAIGAIILIVIAVIVMALLSSAGKGSKQSLLELNAAQADILELTALADAQARDSTIKSQATMLNQTVQSHSLGTVAILGTLGAGKKVDKQIVIYRETSYKDKLAKAAELNNFDSTYKEILSSKLGTYRAKLQNAYGSISDTKQKTELSGYFTQLETLAPSTAQ